MPLASMPPTYMPYHVPSNHRTYPCLYCTHMHYPLCLCAYLVPIGCAEASYYVSITHSSLTHLPPFGTIHLPLYGMLSDPCYASDTLYLRSCFTYIRLPYNSYISSPSHFLDSVLYLASFTVSHLYSELDSDPYIYINP